MDFFAPSPHENVLAELVHDLRQPINNIGLGASYLSLLLGDGYGRAQEQLQMIQKQVERSARILDEAAMELRRLRILREQQSGSGVAQAQATAAH